MEDSEVTNGSHGGGSTDNLNRLIKIESVIRGFVDGVFYSGGDAPIYRRIKSSLAEASPKVREASRNSTSEQQQIG